MEKIYSLLNKYVQSINECNLKLAREIWDSCKETGQYRKRELASKPLCVKEF